MSLKHNSATIICKGPTSWPGGGGQAMGFTPEANFFIFSQSSSNKLFFFSANQNNFFYFNLSINVIKHIIKNKLVFFLRDTKQTFFFVL